MFSSRRISMGNLTPLLNSWLFTSRTKFNPSYSRFNLYNVKSNKNPSVAIGINNLLRTRLDICPFNKTLNTFGSSSKRWLTTGTVTQPSDYQYTEEELKEINTIVSDCIAKPDEDGVTIQVGPLFESKFKNDKFIMEAAGIRLVQLVLKILPLYKINTAEENLCMLSVNKVAQKLSCDNKGNRIIKDPLALAGAIIGIFGYTKLGKILPYPDFYTLERAVESPYEAESSSELIPSGLFQFFPNRKLLNR